MEKLSERHIQNRNKNTIIEPYLNIIYKMLRDGFKGDFIYSYILHTGYTGKPSTMIDIIKCIALNNFRIHLPKDFPFHEDIPPSVSIIQRSDVLRYITLKDHAAMECSDTAKYIAIIKRSGLANLFRKCYAAFSITQTNAPVQSLIPGSENNRPHPWQRY